MSTLAQSQVISEVGQHLYDFLPGKPHPYADRRISFQGIAESLNLGKYWSGGSKLPALTGLLEATFEREQRDFSPLIVEIVKRGIKYKANKGEPITREQIEGLNSLLLRLSLRLPDLTDPQFLRSLPSNVKKLTINKKDLEECKQDLLNLSKMVPQPRGFAFEKFLHNIFAIYGLEPHVSFRLIGEQIDGSLNFENETYLLEAKWQNEPVGNAELLILDGKVRGKSTWSRGLMISYSGFSADGLEAYKLTGPSRLICLDGEDLFHILDGKISLTMVLRNKVRHVAERGAPFISVSEML